MTAEEQIAIIKRVIKATWRIGMDDLHWWAHEEDGEVHVGIICNDLFYWASAECEEITPANIQLLEDTVKELASMDFKCVLETGNLFCCRSRKMRPQAPIYKSIPIELVPLFDACGPYRGPKDNDFIWTGKHDPPELEKAAN